MSESVKIFTDTGITKDETFGQQTLFPHFSTLSVNGRGEKSNLESRDPSSCKSYLLSFIDSNQLLHFLALIEEKKGDRIKQNWCPTCHSTQLAQKLRWWLRLAEARGWEGTEERLSPHAPTHSLYGRQPQPRNDDQTSGRQYEYKFWPHSHLFNNFSKTLCTLLS